jgi:TRAP-type C4-dicarboxylate transport system substrate-binding protein
MTYDHYHNKNRRERHMEKIRSVIIVLAALLFVAFVFPAGVMAQQKVIELTYGTPYNVDHTFSKTDKKWFAKIEKETNGRVKFKPFWGGAIIGGGGGAIDEIAKGVADVGFISPGQAKTGFDLAKASFVFFTGATVKNGRKIFNEARKKFPEFDNEYLSKGLKPICYSSGTDYQLLSKKPVRRLSDFKGLRAKTLGEIVDVLKELGMEGMASPMPEVYMNMQKGVLDAAFTTTETLQAFRFVEVAKYMTLMNLYRPHMSGRVMNLNTFKKLPPDIQKIIENNVEWYGEEADNDVIKGDIAGKDYGAKNGMEYIKLPKEDMDKFYSLVARDAEKEARKLDAKGVPATKIYTEIQRIIKETK